MNKLEVITELKRLALVLDGGEEKLPRRTPVVLRQAAALLEETMQKKKTTPIIELNLSAHAYNALYRRGWLTVEEVKTKTMPELLRVCGIGEKTATEILLAVERMEME